MITRLKINGFKNLVNLEMHFGVFTCIAGTNAVGKSNLFDAIRFLSDLSHKTLLEAAVSIRSEGQKNASIRDLFTRMGDTHLEEMEFEVDMIIPKEGTDDLGQLATASITSVRYELKLRYRELDKQLEIIKEELVPLTLGDTRKNLYFGADKKWKDSVLKGRRGSNAPFISTQRGNDDGMLVQLHNDGISGAPLKQKANALPRTILSTTQAAQHPTAVIVKSEMRSWKMLQLETSSLRKSDELHFVANAHLTETGLHLPATAYRLQQIAAAGSEDIDVYQELANRLSELVAGVSEVQIDKDDKRELLTLMLKFKGGTEFPARALSDGTLRFLGLTVLRLDKKAGSLICLEEPENGIHPQKIEAMLALLQDIAGNINEEVDDYNPLRQVIINTHSPNVVQLVPEDSLLLAHLTTTQINKHKIDQLTLSPMADTWRTRIQTNEKSQKYQPVKMFKLLSYLQPPVNIEDSDNVDTNDDNYKSQKQARRVMQREDVKQLKIKFIDEE